MSAGHRAVARVGRQGGRRTQSERSASTQQRILDATLKCLQERGYARTSLSEIEARARVSRGALLHQFPTKRDLVAEAMTYFYRTRAERRRAQFEAMPADTGSLEARLEALRIGTEEMLSTGIEFSLALRTDAGLRREFIRRFKQRLASSLHEDYEKLLPEFVGYRDAMWVTYVVGCFMRGLALETMESGPEIVAATSKEFARMLSLYAASVSR
jgi:AcrR family transcriptional regulator